MATEEPATPRKDEQLDAGTAFQTLASDVEGTESDEELEQRIRSALECPCIAEIREGPCWPTFADAFTCYLRSKEVEKGSDCLKQFTEMQACILKHPEHFKGLEEEEEEELEVPPKS